MVRGISRHELRKNFFSQRVVDNWNRIPEALKRARSADAFKRSYKQLRLATLTGTLDIAVISNLTLTVPPVTRHTVLYNASTVDLTGLMEVYPQVKTSK